jgi:hypothetical protein
MERSDPSVERAQISGFSNQQNIYWQQLAKKLNTKKKQYKYNAMPGIM